MLLRVAIDPEGLEPGQSGRGIGRAFLNELAQRSVLVHEPGGLRQARSALAEHGHDTLNKVIESLLLHPGRSERLSNDVPGLERVGSLSDLRLWQGKAQLLLLADYRDAVLREEGGSDDPEFCAFDAASDSAAVEALSQRWNTVIDRGTKREVVWKQVFKPLAERCPHVYVIERELGHVLYDDILKRRQRPQTKPGGPAWFLQRLAGAGVKRVSIATSEARVRERHFLPDDVMTTIHDWPGEQGWPLTIDMKLVAGDFQHQRLLAFDGWAGLQIHQGLQTFDYSELKEDAALVAQVALGPRIRNEFDQLARRAR